MARSWGSKFLKFKRVDGKIQAVSNTIIQKNTIVLCEKPIPLKDCVYETFLSATINKLGESGVILPCIFNITDEDVSKVDTDINHLFEDSKNKNRIFKLAMSFDNVKISDKNFYIAIQAVEEKEGGNCARIVLPNGYAFVITTSVVKCGEILSVCTKSNMNEVLNNQIYIKTSSILKSVDKTVSSTENMLNSLFELIDDCVPIEITTEEIEEMAIRLKDYGIRKHLGFLGFKDQLNDLNASIKNFTKNQTWDKDEIEKEFEQHILEQTKKI